MSNVSCLSDRTGNERLGLDWHPTGLDSSQILFWLSLCLGFLFICWSGVLFWLFVFAGFDIWLRSHSNFVVHCNEQETESSFLGCFCIPVAMGFVSVQVTGSYRRSIGSHPNLGCKSSCINYNIQKLSGPIFKQLHFATVMTSARVQKKRIWVWVFLEVFLLYMHFKLIFFLEKRKLQVSLVLLFHSSN